MKSTFDPGDPVDALYTANGEWYPAKVVKRNSDGSYEVEWEDGDQDDRLKEQDEVHPRDGENLSVAASKFVKTLVQKVESVLNKHKAIPAERYTSDTDYRVLVSEMLDSKRTALACLRYTLEDPKSQFDYVASLPLQVGYRKYLGFLKQKVDAEEEEKAKAVCGLRLCMAMGLVTVDVDETTSSGEDGMNTSGWTRLMVAAADGESATVLRSLFAAKADLEAQDEDNSTPLCLAAQYGNEETLRVLVELNADVNGTPGSRPAVLAAIEGNADTIRTLAELGGDVHRADDSGDSALLRAVMIDFVEVTRALLDANADVNAPLPAGEDSESADEDGFCPAKYAGRHILYAAALESEKLARNESVALLLEAKADLDAARPPADETGEECDAVRRALDALAAKLAGGGDLGDPDSSDSE